MPTGPTLYGLVAALVSMWQGITGGTLNGTFNASRTRISYTDPARGAPPTGSPCVRCFAKLDRDQALALKNSTGQRLATSDPNAPFYYVGIQACAATSATPPSDAQRRAVRDLIEDLGGTCQSLPSQAGWASLIVATMDDTAIPQRCACRDSASATGCEVTRDSGATWSVLPARTVASEGTWREVSAGACKRAACVELQGFPSYPAACAQ